MEEQNSVLQLVVGLAIYVVMAITLTKIAKKAGMVSEAWWGWVPILNMVLFLKIAGKPAWWVILMFIPIVNIIVWIMAMMSFVERFGTPAWVGAILAIVNPGALIYMLMVAFGSKTYQAMPAAAAPTPPPAMPPAAPPAA